MKITAKFRKTILLAALSTVGARAEGPDWSIVAGHTLESGESSTVRTYDVSATPTFSVGDDWSIAPSLAWSTFQSSLYDSLSHSLVPSISVDWGPSDHLVVSVGGWISALEDPLDEGGSLRVATHADVVEGVVVEGGLGGGWSQSAQWFASVDAGARWETEHVRCGAGADLTYATVPVSTGRMAAKSLYAFQMGANGTLDVLLGPVSLGPDVSWNGYSYDKKSGKNATNTMTGMSKPSVSGSHSEWNAGMHLSWKVADWLSANAWGARRWTDDESSLDGATRMNKKGKVVVSSAPVVADPTVDKAGVSLGFSW